MPVACPNCGTRFKLPAGQVIGPAGRKVRCARCHHVWVQAPDLAPVNPGRWSDPGVTAFHDDEGRDTKEAFDAFGEETQNPWDDLTGLIPPDPIPAVAPSPPLWRRAPVQWAALAAALIIVLGGFVVGRQTIVGLWPRSVLLYDALGLVIEVPGQGLAFQNVHSSFERQEDAGIITVTGEILNTTATLRQVPPVKVTALRADGQALDIWIIPAEPTNLLPGEVARFETKQPDPGETADVEVTFDSGQG